MIVVWCFYKNIYDIESNDSHEDKLVCTEAEEFDLTLFLATVDYNVNSDKLNMFTSISLTMQYQYLSNLQDMCMVQVVNLKTRPPNV